MSWLVFHDALNGPPYSSVPGSPLAFLHPQLLRQLTRSLLGAAHIPLKRGGADAARIQASMFASQGDRAHIPQQRGGAPAG